MKIKTFFKRHWDEGVVYLLALLGTLFSNNLEAFKGQEALKLDLSAGRLGMAAFLALFISFLMELVPFKLSEEAKDAVSKGKQKNLNLMRRFVGACVFGFASPYLVDVLIRGLSAKVGG